MKADVTFDWKDVRAGVENLKAKFPQAVRRALTRAGNSGRAAMVKEIAEDTGLPSRTVREAIRVNLVGDQAVQLEVTGNRIPLIDFRARGPEPSRGKGRGVSYRLPGGRGRAEHAFIATMPSGHRGVFQRSEGARSVKTAKGRSGLPIYELRGPSLVHVFSKKMSIGVERTQEALVTNLRSEINFALRR